MAKPSHRKGELLALSSGGTTYYHCSGLYRALVDFNLGELAEQYCRQAPYRQGTLDALNKGMVTIEQITQMEAVGAFSHRDISDQGFGSYLINRGYLQLVMIDEVHCGAGFSPDLVRESANARAQSLSQLSGGLRMNALSPEPITQEAPGGDMAERAACPVCGCEDSPDYLRRVTDWFHAHWLSCRRCGYQTATHPAFESAERDWDKASTGRQAEEAGLLVPAVQVFSMRDLELLESLQMQVPDGDCARTYLVSRDALERWKEVARLGRDEVDESLAPAVASVEREIAALLHAQQDED